MALTDKLKGRFLAIMMGDGATPTEVFAPMCGLNDKSFQQTRATSDTTDWDCADPDLPPVIVRDLGASDWTISGSGLLHRPLLADVQAAFDSGSPTNFRWAYNDDVIDGYYAGPGIITDFTQTGANEGYVQISLTISAAGPAAFVANA